MPNSLEDGPAKRLKGMRAGGLPKAGPISLWSFEGMKPRRTRVSTLKAPTIRGHVS